uniref:Uncharacterized protein n=1 Tax=Octopus bimaculoides TaxID=37653 RepID=A0A0L8HB55_OCTBM
MITFYKLFKVPVYPADSTILLQVIFKFFFFSGNHIGEDLILGLLTFNIK